jgi:hypothetical protein
MGGHVEILGRDLRTCVRRVNLVAIVTHEVVLCDTTGREPGSAQGAKRRGASHEPSSLR